MRYINIDYSTTPPTIDTKLGGEEGENNAVSLVITPEEGNEDIATYVMYFALEDGILPSASYEVADTITIPLGVSLTQTDTLPCQFIGLSEDGETVVSKTPVIELHFGESITGDIVTDPSTGETIFTQIAYLQTTAETLIDIAEQIDLTDYYTKTETDALLAEKADLDDFEELEVEVATKADSEDVYTINEVDNLLNAKTDVTDFNSLSATVDTKADASSVYTRTQVNNLLNDKVDTDDYDTFASGVLTALNAKADSSNVYTKTQTDNLLSAKANSNDVYTQTEVDNQFNLFGTYIDNGLATKQNTLTAGNNIQIDSSTNTISATDTVYTLPISTPNTLGGVMIDGETLGINAETGFTYVDTSKTSTFVAEYGVTEYQEIVDAFNADRGVACSYTVNNDTFYCSLFRKNGTKFFFISPPIVGAILSYSYQFTIDNDGVWSSVDTVDVISGYDANNLHMGNIIHSDDATSGIQSNRNVFSGAAIVEYINGQGYRNAAEVQALIDASAYSLPTASTSTLGGVKVDGDTITIADGVISAQGGGASVFTVNFTNENDVITADKTVAQIIEAYNNGNIVQGLYTAPDQDVPYIFELIMVVAEEDFLVVGLQVMIETGDVLQNITLLGSNDGSDDGWDIMTRNIPGVSDIPTAVSELTNDSGYQTATEVQALIDASIGDIDTLIGTGVIE